MIHIKKLHHRLLFSVALIFCVASLAHAAVEREGFLIDSVLKTSAEGSTNESRSKVILDDGEPNWVEVSKRSDGQVLFARRTGGEGDTIMVEFKLVDRRQAEEKVLSNMKIVTRLGETATVTVGKSGEVASEIELSMTPKRVKYTLDR